MKKYIQCCLIFNVFKKIKKVIKDKYKVKDNYTVIIEDKVNNKVIIEDKVNNKEDKENKEYLNDWIYLKD